MMNDELESSLRSLRKFYLNGGCFQAAVVRDSFSLKWEVRVSGAPISVSRLLFDNRDHAVSACRYITAQDG